MPPAPADRPHLIRLAVEGRRLPHRFDLAPPAADLAALAQEMGLQGLRKLRFQGEVLPDGRNDWRLTARLGATVVQDCVVTLVPVTTRIDEPVTRRYLADLTDPGPGEVEMPEDETAEALPPVLDLTLVMAEALALALPPWPRAPGVAFDGVEVAAPGVAPLSRANPFAALAAFKADPDPT